MRECVELVSACSELIPLGRIGQAFDETTDCNRGIKAVAARTNVTDSRVGAWLRSLPMPGEDATSVLGSCFPGGF